MLTSYSSVLNSYDILSLSLTISSKASQFAKSILYGFFRIIVLLSTLLKIYPKLVSLVTPRVGFNLYDISISFSSPYVFSNFIYCIFTLSSLGIYISIVFVI